MPAAVTTAIVIPSNPVLRSNGQLPFRTVALSDAALSLSAALGAGDGLGAE